jgi:hypothetical protein
MPEADVRLGVPPPKYTEVRGSGVPGVEVAIAETSASKRSMYAASAAAAADGGVRFDCTTTGKLQYPHL